MLVKPMSSMASIVFLETLPSSDLNETSLRIPAANELPGTVERDKTDAGFHSFS